MVYHKTIKRNKVVGALEKVVDVLEEAQFDKFIVLAKKGKGCHVTAKIETEEDFMGLMFNMIEFAEANDIDIESIVNEVIGEE